MNVLLQSVCGNRPCGPVWVPLVLSPAKQREEVLLDGLSLASGFPRAHSLVSTLLSTWGGGFLQISRILSLKCCSVLFDPVSCELQLPWPPWMLSLIFSMEKMTKGVLCAPPHFTVSAPRHGNSLKAIVGLPSVVSQISESLSFVVWCLMSWKQIFSLRLF